MSITIARDEEVTAQHFSFSLKPTFVDHWNLHISLDGVLILSFAQRSSSEVLEIMQNLTTSGDLGNDLHFVDLDLDP